MKKLLCLSAAVIAFAGMISMGNQMKVGAQEELTECKSAYLCEVTSGTEAYSVQPTKRLPIASMCKIMTLLLTFEEVEGGRMSYDEPIVVSENASGMGGSQVFLQTGLSYPVQDLIKSVVVCSANDSCVALAERICGSEANFVDRMNERARGLGACDTLFANCTGLPKDPQYSCAKDVAAMFRELIKHEKYFEYSKIWTEDMRHPDGRTTVMTNTNKLVRFLDGCDGGKTGYTAQAGFCLAATVCRGGVRLISVVIGANTSDVRFQNTKNMINYAFSNYEKRICLSSKNELEQTARVSGSAVKEIKLIPSHDLTVFLPKGSDKKCEVVIEINENVCAPVEKEEVLGNATLYLDGVEVDCCKLLSSESAEKFSWFEALEEIIHAWN
ncbi:MAG: D-alanyl-D-alanine carboxypeptidase [Clostridia bacterium]|nr:D-alanyl-D-alanine carboxypeptidase [Clostridia bacterium]